MIWLKLIIRGICEDWYFLLFGQFHPHQPQIWTLGDWRSAIPSRPKTNFRKKAIKIKSEVILSKKYQNDRFLLKILRTGTKWAMIRKFQSEIKDRFFPFIFLICIYVGTRGIALEHGPEPESRETGTGTNFQDCPDVVVAWTKGPGTKIRWKKQQV